MIQDNVERADARDAQRRSRRGALGLVAAAVGAVSPIGVFARKKDKCKNRDSEEEVLKYIRKAAKKYNQSRNAMERVARCESNLDPCAVNRSGPYYGLFQYLKSTWKSTPYGNRDIYDPKAQALATAWMWKQGRKNEWACQ
jgi:hypothetical protein